MQNDKARYPLLKSRSQEKQWAQHSKQVCEEFDDPYRGSEPKKGQSVNNGLRLVGQ
jgi:hypothetical protein